MSKLRTLVLAGLVLAGMGSLAGSAQASDYYHKPAYRTVIVYETVKKPYVYYVTKYDECGHPYKAKVVGVKLVKVPVEKVVKVHH